MPVVPEIVLIAAVARNRAIGKDNRLLWNIPQDMAHFRKLTTQAQEDDWVAIKRALHDEKIKNRALKAENESLKEQVQSFSGDQAEVIRRQATLSRHKDSEIRRANDNFTAERKLNFVLKKRIAELEAEIRNQVIPL